MLATAIVAFEQVHSLFNSAIDVTAPLREQTEQSLLQVKALQVNLDRAHEASTLQTFFHLCIR